MASGFRFLTRSAMLMAAAGVGLFAWTLVASMAPARDAFRKREPRLGPKEDQSSPKQDTDTKNKQYQEGGLAATVQGMSPSTDSSPRESTTSSTEKSSGTGSSKKIAAYSSSTGSASVTL